MSNVKTSVRVVISIFLLSLALTDAQAQISPFSRRQQFNLFRQLQLQRSQPSVTEEQQEDGVIERQSEPQLAQVSIKCKKIK